MWLVHNPRPLRVLLGPMAAVLAGEVAAEHRLPFLHLDGELANVVNDNVFLSLDSLFNLFFFFLFLLLIFFAFLI